MTVRVTSKIGGGCEENLGYVVTEVGILITSGGANHKSG